MIRHCILKWAWNDDLSMIYKLNFIYHLLCITFLGPPVVLALVQTIEKNRNINFHTLCSSPPMYKILMNFNEFNEFFLQNKKLSKLFHY